MALVDVETTGMGAHTHRIIEIAIIRIEGSRIVEKFTSYVNPEMSVPRFITYLTGISDRDVADAPPFSEIQDKVASLLTGATFVAHNVWFDYSFIQSEFERGGGAFASKKCCTVRLSRRLFPEHKSHSLQSLIQRYHFKYTNRHRAYDDAYVLWQFLKKIKSTFPKEYVQEEWNRLVKE